MATQHSFSQRPSCAGEVNLRSHRQQRTHLVDISVSGGTTQISTQTQTAQIGRGHRSDFALGVRYMAIKLNVRLSRWRQQRVHDGSETTTLKFTTS